jgi:hypothetical protein
LDCVFVGAAARTARRGGRRFHRVGRRRTRPSAFLDSYGKILTPDEVIARVRLLIDDQIQLMRQNASAGDATYQRMLEHDRAHDLELRGENFTRSSRPR